METTSSYGAMGAVVIDSFQGIETDTKALGDKLASRATWVREEVAKGFESAQGRSTSGREQRRHTQRLKN